MQITRLDGSTPIHLFPVFSSFVDLISVPYFSCVVNAALYHIYICCFSYRAFRGPTALLLTVIPSFFERLARALASLFQSLTFASLGTNVEKVRNAERTFP